MNPKSLMSIKSIDMICCWYGRTKFPLSDIFFCENGLLVFICLMQLLETFKAVAGKGKFIPHTYVDTDGGKPKSVLEIRHSRVHVSEKNRKRSRSQSLKVEELQRVVFSAAYRVPTILKKDALLSALRRIQGQSTTSSAIISSSKTVKLLDNPMAANFVMELLELSHEELQKKANERKYFYHIDWCISFVFCFYLHVIVFTLAIVFTLCCDQSSQSKATNNPRRHRAPLPVRRIKIRHRTTTLQ
jgi:hypothetical protein